LKNSFVPIGRLLLLYVILSLLGIVVLPFCAPFLSYLIPAHFISSVLALLMLGRWQKCYRKEEFHIDEQKALIFRWVIFLFRIMMVLYFIVYLFFGLKVLTQFDLIKDVPVGIGL
jgi:hypothetical protein